MKRFISYSFFLVGLITITYVSNTGLQKSSSVKARFLQENSQQFGINNWHSDSKALEQKTEQPTIIEIQTNNSQGLSDSDFELRLIWTKMLVRQKLLHSSIQYFSQLFLQQSNGYYLYFLCKMLI